MAIQPPSDILLDVASAADPAQVRAATARLAKLAADPTVIDKDFGRALAAANAAAKSTAGPNSAGQIAASQLMASPTTASDAPTPHATADDVATLKRTPTHKGDVYQKFEAVLLQNFVEAMLPKDDSLYGGRDSADSYRSMMAEQLANQIAKAGGIGIAKAVEHAHPAHAAPPPLSHPLEKA